LSNDTKERTTKFERPIIVET